MRKRLYSNESPLGRNNSIVNNYKVNNSEVNNDTVNNSIAINNSINNYNVIAIKRMLTKMSPQYKAAGKAAMADPLAFRMQKVIRLLRKRLDHQDFLQAAKHLDQLPPMEQAQFCQQIEEYYEQQV